MRREKRRKREKFDVIGCNFTWSDGRPFFAEYFFFAEPNDVNGEIHPSGIWYHQSFNFDIVIDRHLVYIFFVSFTRFRSNYILAPLLTSHSIMFFCDRTRIFYYFRSLVVIFYDYCALHVLNFLCELTFFCVFSSKTINSLSFIAGAVIFLVWFFSLQFFFSACEHTLCACICNSHIFNFDKREGKKHSQLNETWHARMHRHTLTYAKSLNTNHC